MKKYRKMAALTAAVVITLTACASGASQTVSETPSSISGKDGTSAAETKQVETTDGKTVELAETQTLTLLFNNVYTLDFNKSGWVSEKEITAHTQAGLLRAVTQPDNSEAFVEDAAESYEISDDGLVYTFHLRENHWSDGQPVKAQEYVDNYIRELTPENGFTNVANYNFVKNAQAYYTGEVSADEVGVKALDDATFEIILEVPDINAIQKIAGVSYPIRLDVVEKASSYGDNAKELLYSGAFVIDEWIPDNKMVLKKNENYWDADNIYLETVNLITAKESATQATLFDSQQLDLVEYNDDFAEIWNSKAEAGEIQAVVYPKSYTRWLIYNQNGKSGLMGNAKVRLAISLAINRQEYVDTLYNRYYPAWDFTPPTVTVEGLPYNSFDSGNITELLEEYPDSASWQELLKEGLDEVGYPYTDLKDVIINYSDKSVNTIDQTRIEYLKQNLEKELGITIEVVSTSDFAYMQGDYDITTAGWTSASPYGALTLFDKVVGKPTLNGYYVDNGELQPLFDSAIGVTDPEKVVSIYKEIERKMIREAWVAPIYWGDARYFVQNYVQGFDFHTITAYNDFSRAYILKHD
ncbi:MAG: peptide ABC transporter substrate-binding protein [bacterium]|nr:peptide ABC transporter substrate-binding protein [bacterium]